MRKIINWLYNRYCKPEAINTLYLGNIQRDFSKQLNKKEEQERNLACLLFVQSNACEQIFNDIIGTYVQTLFNIGETEKVRDEMFRNINVVLRVENTIKDCAGNVEQKQEFDKFETI